MDNPFLTIVACVVILIFAFGYGWHHDGNDDDFSSPGC